MRTRWNSHSFLETIIEYVRALRERVLDGRCPECQDGTTLQYQFAWYASFPWKLRVMLVQCDFCFAMLNENQYVMPVY
jgi:hypothetical protein